MLLRLAAGCYRRRDATDSSPTLNSPQRRRGPPLGPRGATVAGLAFAVAGLFPSLAGLGLIPARFSPGVPPWVVIAAGSMLILAGISVVNNYAFGGGVQPDGDLGPEASFAVRLVSYLLSLANRRLDVCRLRLDSVRPRRASLLIVGRVCGTSTASAELRTNRPNCVRNLRRIARSIPGSFRIQRRQAVADRVA
jgi:hypothetical protein